MNTQALLTDLTSEQEESVSAGFPLLQLQRLLPQWVFNLPSWRFRLPIKWA